MGKSKQKSLDLKTDMIYMLITSVCKHLTVTVLAVEPYVGSDNELCRCSHTCLHTMGVNGGYH